MVGLVIKTTDTIADIVLHEIENETVMPKKSKQIVQIQHSDIHICTENKNQLMLNYKYNNENVTHDNESNTLTFVENVTKFFFVF